MTRFARDRRVFFVEEPVFHGGGGSRLDVTRDGPITIAVPQLPEGSDAAGAAAAQRGLVDELLDRHRIGEYVNWYYTPMALAFTDHLTPCAVVYDCMDELSAFQGAPAILKEREAELMRRASLVLTGGQSLYEAKRHGHPNIHPFPSSVDAAHFARARTMTDTPADQLGIPHPRLGYFGVIDERMDYDLIAGVADARPDWHVVMVGPIVKIDPASVPHRPNIHYLGPKRYEDLPRYIAGWDVALLPFARNEATRFISPTKTPEYLAAGKPVVSTSIRDVIRPYGRQGLARIADDVPAFVRACTAAMGEDPSKRITQADAFLRQTSWDGTWSRMRQLVDAAVSGSAVPEGRELAGDATAV